MGEFEAARSLPQLSADLERCRFRRSLEKMISNGWKCHDGLLVNVDPDGSITRGCYVRSRGEIRCGDCGFTPVAELSGALAEREGLDLQIAQQRIQDVMRVLGNFAVEREEGKTREE